MLERAAPAVVGALAHLDRSDPARLLVLALHDVPGRDIAAAELSALVHLRRPVSLDEVLAAHRGEQALPPRSVLVTLDDGDPSVADAADVFADLGVPAVCFVVSDLVGTDAPFWWQEVARLTRWGARASGPGPAVGAELVLDLKGRPDRDRRRVLEELRRQVPEAPRARQLTPQELHVLEDAGIEVGGHSATHPILVQCDDETLRREVEGSRSRLAELLGRAPRAFAHPSGRVDDRVRAAVRAAGWEVAFAWDHAWTEVPFADPMAVSRVQFSLGSGRVRLARLAAGWHPSLGIGSP